MAATVLSVGSVVVTASGGATGDLLQQIKNAVASIGTADIVTVGSADASIPAAPGSPSELIINPGYSGNPSIPAGYTYVINGSTLAVSGSASVVVGNDLNYSGSAGTVVAVGTGTVNDSATGANIGVQGSYDITASGGNDTISADSGSSGVITAEGTSETVNLGGGQSSVVSDSTIYIDSNLRSGPNVGGVGGAGDSSGATTVNAVTGSGNPVYVYTATDFLASGGSNTIVANAVGVLTLTATGGSQTVIDNFGGDDITTGPATEYFNDQAASTETTITGGSGGADTVWALQSVEYDGSAAASSFLAAGFYGASAVTVGANASVFTGSAGGVYTENSASTGSMTFLGDALGQGTTVVANDTLEGAAATQHVLAWGNNNENLTVSLTGSAAYGAGGDFVAYGSSDTINAMNSGGGDSFVVWNTKTGGTDFVGNTTLVGATAGNEDFAIIAGTAAGGAAAADPHTIDIQNWASTDVLYMGGYSNADLTTAQDALNAAGGAATQFTLSDGTTIKFENTSPTHIFFTGGLFT